MFFILEGSDLGIPHGCMDHQLELLPCRPNDLSSIQLIQRQLEMHPEEYLQWNPLLRLKSGCNLNTFHMALKEKFGIWDRVTNKLVGYVTLKKEENSIELLEFGTRIQCSRNVAFSYRILRLIEAKAKELKKFTRFTKVSFPTIFEDLERFLKDSGYMIHSKNNDDQITIMTYDLENENKQGKTVSWWTTWNQNVSYRIEKMIQVPLPHYADIVVVGGGLSGCSVAYWLSQNGHQCVVLDKGDLCDGATGRNGGHLKADYRSPLWKFEETAIAKILSTIKKLELEVDLKQTGSVALALTPSQKKKMIARYHKYKQKKPLEFWDAATCSLNLKSPPNHFQCGVFDPAGNTWNPAKFTHGLVKYSSQATFFPYHKVLDLKDLENGHRLITTTKGEIECRLVVVCANAWTPRILPELSGIMYTTRNQVLMTKPTLKMWDFSFSTNISSTSEYAFQRNDGRICVGGFRGFTFAQSVGMEKETLSTYLTQLLSTYLQTHFPSLQQHANIEQEWSGIISLTADGKPLLGSLPKRKNVYLLGGYNGHGIPMAFGGAELLVDHMLGKDSQNLQVLNYLHPSRFSLIST